jgi:hypothetical protein
MRKQLTEEQIADARRMREANMSYPEIKAKLGVDVAHDTIRAHCADVLVEGKARTRTDQVRQGKDGRTIRPFDDEDDGKIIDWVLTPVEHQDARGTMADLARTLDRKRHSVAARIQTLRKHGKIPTE